MTWHEWVKIQRENNWGFPGEVRAWRKRHWGWLLFYVLIWGTWLYAIGVLVWSFL